ncbi:MAG: ArnT family glycosyltransferase, partial [Planctomycetia bacterium]
MMPRSAQVSLSRWITYEPLALAVALGLWWCVAVGSTLGKSATSDEPLHIVGGASYWRLDDYRLHPENGNLPQRWCGLPLALAGWPLPSFDHPGWARSDMARLSRAYLFETGNPSRSMLLAARSFAAVWGVLIGLLVYRWSRELFGREGAWLSLAFCLTDTTLLANAPLATSDACAAFFFTWSTLALWRMLELPSPRTAAVAAVAVAGLFLAKFSAPLEVLVGFFLLAIRWRYGSGWEVGWRGRRWRVSTGTGLAAVGACLLVVGVVAWLAVWLAFGFRYAAMNPHAVPAGEMARWGSLDAAVRELGGGKGRLLSWLGGHHV